MAYPTMTGTSSRIDVGPQSRRLRRPLPLADLLWFRRLLGRGGELDAWVIGSVDAEPLFDLVVAHVRAHELPLVAFALPDLQRGFLRVRSFRAPSAAPQGLAADVRTRLDHVVHLSREVRIDGTDQIAQRRHRQRPHVARAPAESPRGAVVQVAHVILSRLALVSMSCQSAASFRARDLAARASVYRGSCTLAVLSIW